MTMNPVRSSRRPQFSNPVHLYRPQARATACIRTSFTPCAAAAASTRASSGEGLPAKRRLLRKARNPRPWSDLTSDKNGDEHDRQDDDFDQPISLAALSRAQGNQQRTTGQRNRPKTQPVQRTSCPQEPLPEGGSPVSLSSAQGGLQGPSTVSSTSGIADLSTSPTTIPTTIVTTLPGAPGPESREEGRTAEGLGADPGPRHPPVTFRTAAELRRMLQARQATAAEAEPWPSSAADAAEESGKARRAAPTTDSQISPVAGGAVGAPPPRRFFGPPPAAARPSSAHGAADSSQGRGANVGHSDSDRTDSSSSRGAAVRQGQAVRLWAGTTTVGSPMGAEAREGLGWYQAGGGTAAAGMVVTDAAAATGSAAGSSGLASSLEEDRDYLKAKQLALALLERSPLPRVELGRRLLSRGHHRRHVEPLLDWLADSGVLNDRLYARMFAASKWNANLTAPSKIQKDLAAQGVSAEDVAAALVHVFGPSRRVRLMGASTAEELDVRAALLEGARRHAEKGSGVAAKSAAPDVAAGSSSGESRGSGRGGSGGRASGHADWVAEAKARAKERDSKRRRLAMWLQYRGHEMDVVLKVFEVLKI